MLIRLIFINYVGLLTFISFIFGIITLYNIRFKWKMLEVQDSYIL